VDDFCARENVDILARIPFRRRVAEICAEGGLAIDADPEVAAALTGLFRTLQSREVRA
jgi:MinD superfamily P-loop ATPase